MWRRHRRTAEEFFEKQRAEGIPITPLVDVNKSGISCEVSDNALQAAIRVLVGIRKLSA